LIVVFHRLDATSVEVLGARLCDSSSCALRLLVLHNAIKADGLLQKLCAAVVANRTIAVLDLS
jgi:hypothetical protein